MVETFQEDPIQIAQVPGSLAELLDILQDESSPRIVSARAVNDFYIALSAERDLILADNETEDDVRASIARLRNMRCSRTHASMENVQMISLYNRTICANFATILFMIEANLTLKLSLDEWKHQLASGQAIKLTDASLQSQFPMLITQPEEQILRMPMSQLLNNLVVLENEHAIDIISKNSDQVDTLSKTVDALFARACILMNFALPKDDLDLVDEEYMVIPQSAQRDADPSSVVFHLEEEEEEEHVESYIASFELSAKLRILFDSLFNKLRSHREMAKMVPSQRHADASTPTVDLDALENWIRVQMISFEQEFFLQEFTNYVVELKTLTQTMEDLYQQRYPETRNPDARTIISCFLGRDAIVDYNDCSMEEVAEKKYALEFTLLLWLRETYQVSPTHTTSKTGYLVQSKLNLELYTYYNCATDTCTPWCSFLEATWYWLRERRFQELEHLFNK